MMILVSKCASLKQPMEDQIKELVDPIYRSKVLAARKLSAAQKLSMGGDLFTEVCGRMRSGIRMQFPDKDEQEVHEILRKRLRRLHQLEPQTDLSK